jgi:chloramphenicol-sensitive protein RarD
LALAPPHPEARRGALAAVGAFTFWGLIPVYWKWLAHISSVELIMHRAVWSLAFLLGVLGWQKQLGLIWQAFRSKRLIGLNLATGSLLMANWLTFIWAVNNGHILDSSLGYFLVPLLNVAAGFIFYHERPRPLQWLAIALAAAGVGWLLVRVDHVPWASFVIAGTWSAYGLIRKKSPMGALDGLTVETLLFLPLTAGYLVWLAAQGGGALGHVSARDHVLVLCSGWITAIPLVWFAYGARRIRLTTLGLLQYIGPSLAFLLGWLVYHEPFDGLRAVSFGLIWAGLACYSADSFWSQRKALFG